MEQISNTVTNDCCSLLELRLKLFSEIFLYLLIIKIHPSIQVWLLLGRNANPRPHQRFSG